MIWKDIPGYEGIYKLSEFGDVFCSRINHCISQQIGRGGYRYVVLWKDAKEKHISVHRLVASVFIPNPNNYPVVMHLDNDKMNCHYLNLKWGTVSDNTKQAADDGLMGGPRYYYEIYKDGQESIICHGYEGINEYIPYLKKPSIHFALKNNSKFKYGDYAGYQVRRVTKPFTYDNTSC